MVVDIRKNLAPMSPLSIKEVEIKREIKQKVGIYHGKITEVTNKIGEAKSLLEMKVHHLVERQSEKDLLHNRQESLEAQKDRLLVERHKLHSQLVSVLQEEARRRMESEEERFMEEVQNFNTNYGLTSNREELLSAQAKAEAQRLDLEADTLIQEIRSLKSENLHLNALQMQKREAQRELQELQQSLRDLEEKIHAAVSTSKSLEEEKISISHNPQHDAECLRLKKELESYKDDNLRDTYESLCMEIDFLQRVRALCIDHEIKPLSGVAVDWFQTRLHFVLRKANCAEVCYTRVGCFSDAKPWAGTVERPVAKLPWDPAKINTRFLLYTRNNQNSYQAISAANPSTISSSNFRTSRKTRVVIHGFTDSGESTWLSDICRKLFQIEDVNCIAVDWSGGSRTQYTQASNNVRVVGAEVAYFVDILSKNFAYSPANVHLIGHSLGAHAAGEAGKRKSGIGRITGLDPAEPYFQNTPTEVRLDLSDAKLVDVIHTDAGPLVPSLGFGMSQVIGHLDFFPNGGIQMPGCPQNIEIPNVSVEDIWNGVVNFITCNHLRAIKYYTDSITNSNTFVSYPCSNWSTYQKGSCKTCPSAGCPKMGHYADTYRGVTSSSQVFYLSTP
ncbi:pancreatic lipase-related protein 2-like [Gastrophryne carolinensis]